MILIEQERFLNSEVPAINDAALYTINSPEPTMITIKDYGNVTLAADGILLIKFDASPGALGIDANYGIYVRVKVGSSYVYAINLPYTSPGFTTVGLAVWLAAGTYDIKIEGMCETSPSYAGFIQNFQAGITAFNDQQGSTVGTYTAGIALTVAARNTPAGPLKNSVYLANCYAVTAGAASNFENVGDILTNGVAVSFDGVQMNWDERNQDPTSGVMGACAKAARALAVGSVHTVTLSKRNAATAVTISVISCPWILPAGVYEPVTINFSQGSTLYAYLSPLFADVSKFAGVGRPHAVSFGAGTDYYDSATGTALVKYAFIFDVPDISQVGVYFMGLGGCVEIFGADVR